MFEEGSIPELPAADWTSSNGAAASVESNGRALAVAPGTSTITASMAGITGSSTAVAGDFAVERRHRTFYPALALQKTAVSTCNAGEFGGYTLSWSDDGKIRVSDIMACDDVFDGLLTAFIRQQRERDAYCITILYFCDGALVSRLQRFGFLFRRTDSDVLLCANPDVPAPERLFDSKNWYLLEGDSDS